MISLYSGCATTLATVIPTHVKIREESFKMRTAGTFQQDSPQTDGQLFIAAPDFIPLVAAGAVIASTGAGLVTLNTPASTTVNLFSNLGQLLRTGILASFGQSAFGTAASVPGPSAVPNTSSPSGLVGRPPFLAAQEPPIIGPIAGAILKGITINSVDVIYQVGTLALTSATVGLTATVFGLPGAGATAPVVTSLIALAVNGLPVAVAANPVTTRVAVITAQQAMIVTPETEVLLNVNFVTPATSTVKLYGAVLNIQFNWN
jgi:hypothetical protein